MERIKENWEKYRREIVLFALLAIVSTVSFGLGYLAALEYERAPIVIETGAGGE